MSDGKENLNVSSSGDSASLQIALWAASRGWAVVRVTPGRKHPMEKWRELGVRTPDEVREAWGKRTYSVGILTGPSMLVDDDLDMDPEGNPAGAWNLEELARGRELPRTFTVSTPSGGTHLVWANPNGRQFKTSGGTHNGQVGGVIPGAPYIDVRGRGGMFVLWSPDGKRVVTDARPPVPMPQWLSDLHPEPDSIAGGIRVARGDVSKWLNDHGGGDICPEMDATMHRSIRLMQQITPHDAMTQGVYALVGDRVIGHMGLKLALDELHYEFERAMKGKTREREKREEWANAVAGAIAKKDRRGNVSFHDPCKIDFSNVTLSNPKTIQWLGNRKRQLIKWLWLGYLPLGCMVMLDGESGHGKTLALYDIAARASRGWPMPDGTQAMKGPVNSLVLAPEEMTDSIIVPRLMAAGADLSRIAIPRNIKAKRGKAQEMYLLPESAHKIVSMIREADASLLIIDPITSFLAPTINSSNDASVRFALSPLSAALGETQCCAPMVRHFNKNQQMDARYRGGGSVAFAAIARVHIIAAKMPEEYSGEGQ